MYTPPLSEYRAYGAWVSVWFLVAAPVRAKTTLPTVAGLVLARMLRLRLGKVARFSCAPEVRGMISAFVLAFTSV